MITHKHLQLFTLTKQEKTDYVVCEDDVGENEENNYLVLYYLSYQPFFFFFF